MARVGKGVLFGCFGLIGFCVLGMVLTGLAERNQKQARAEREAEATRVAVSEAEAYLKEHGWTPEPLPPPEILALAEKWKAADAESERRDTQERCKKKGTSRLRDPACLALECPGQPEPHYATAAAKKVSIGMSSCLVKAAWGQPEDINRTIRGDGVSEQWVYSSQYLYFDDGKLTTIQD